MSVIKPLDVPPGFNVAFSTNYTDASGNPVAPPQTLVWASSDPTIIALAVAPDGLSTIGTRVGPIGIATVTVTDGTVTDSEVCNVVNAASIGLSSKLVAV
jgi:hypothetical protein